MPSSPNYPPFIFSSLTATSDAADFYGTTLCGLFMPAAFTGASVSFTACDTVDGTFVPVYDDTNTQMVIAVATSRYYATDPTVFAGLRFIRLVSAAAEASGRVVKTSARHIA